VGNNQLGNSSVIYKGQRSGNSQVGITSWGIPRSFTKVKGREIPKRVSLAGEIPRSELVAGEFPENSQR
jgi:hypothetical protein